MESQSIPAEQHRAAPRSKKLMWASLVGVIVLVLVWAFVLWHMRSSASPISQADVSIGQTGINPATVIVHAGQSVVITNRDTQPHNLTADDTELPGFATVEPLDHGDSHSYTFDKKGTYRFYDPANPSNYAATVVVE